MNYLSRRAAALTCAVLMSVAPAAIADPAPRSEAPNTDSCPNATQPPQAEDTSEALQPGQVAPTPPPVVANEFGSCGVTAAAGFVEPENTASAWMVFDLDSGDVIATKDPHGRYRPASIIKVLLALVALQELDLSRTYVATAEDQNQEGSAVGIREGLTYTNEQLMLGLLLNSGNDAAHAIAAQLGGDAATLEKVRAKARELGAVDTYVASYNGLDAPGMMTSARDLAVFYKAAWQNPTFARMVATEKVTFPDKDPGTTFEVWNDNGLFMNDNNGIGGKTGYTDDAHHTFVGAKTVGTRRLAAVVLDTTIDKGRAWEQAQKLIDASSVATGSVGNLGQAQTTTAAPTPLPQPSVPSSRSHSGLYFALAGLLAVCAVVMAYFSGRRKE